MARIKIGPESPGGIPGGGLSRGEIREVDPRTLIPSSENERVIFSTREVILLLGIGADKDRRSFDNNSLTLPLSLSSLTDDKDILGRPNINEKWKKLMELAMSMYSDSLDGAKPGGILEVMRNQSGESLIIAKGHRRQLGGIIAGVKVWVLIVENVKSKLKRARQRAAENLQREDLDLPETIELYINIMDGLKDEGKTVSQAETLKILNKSKGWISTIHRAATSSDIKSAIDAGGLTSLRELQNLLVLPKVKQAAMLRELGADISDNAVEKSARPKRSGTVAIKLGSTKNMRFMARLIAHALKDSDIKEYRDDILDGADLKNLDENTMTSVWATIIETVNAATKT